MERVRDSGCLAARQELGRRLPAPPSVVQYAVRLARATRPTEPDASLAVKNELRWGWGTRAWEYVVRGAKARAAVVGRWLADLDGVWEGAL